MSSGLTPKQQKFVEEYLVDLNATAAAKRAGYSQKTARFIGAENLTKLNIQEAIAARTKELTDENELSPAQVLQELALIAKQDMDDYVEWGPDGVTLRPSEGMDTSLTRVVAEVSQTVTKEGGSIKFKLHDKLKALELIGRYHALFTDKHKIEGDEAMKKIAELLEMKA